MFEKELETVLNYLRVNSPATLSEIADATKLSIYKAGQVISFLNGQGIVGIKNKKQGHTTLIWLKESGRPW